jgi:hypothetical protein
LAPSHWATIRTVSEFSVPLALQLIATDAREIAAASQIVLEPPHLLVLKISENHVVVVIGRPARNGIAPCFPCASQIGLLGSNAARISI